MWTTSIAALKLKLIKYAPDATVQMCECIFINCQCQLNEALILHYIQTVYLWRWHSHRQLRFVTFSKSTLFKNYKLFERIFHTLFSCIQRENRIYRARKSNSSEFFIVSHYLCIPWIIPTWTLQRNLTQFPFDAESPFHAQPL